jgi:hypothetical protein
MKLEMIGSAMERAINLVKNSNTPPLLQTPQNEEVAVHSTAELM